MAINVLLMNQSEISQFCISELKYYLSSIFKVEVTECFDLEASNIVLGIKDNEALTDTIDIHFLEGKGEIYANTEVGLLIAVYRYLEQLGMRYLRPGRENEVIPQLTFDEFKKNIHISESASFRHRGVCIEGADSYENLRDFIDWLPKVGFNTFFIQFENPYSFFKRWYEHEFNPYIEAEEFSIEIAQEMSDLIDKEMLQRGLVHHRVGHGWTGEVLGYSSKYGWESGLKLPEEKKPFVAELNGERELFATAPILTSLDFANDEVTHKMVELIVDYAKERKEVDYLHVWLSDARNNICECDQCQKDIPSDQYVRMLNQLDARLTEEGLNTRICFLLYHELLFAPKKEKINNQDRFTMMFAPITRTFEKSYADVDYDGGIPEAKAYVRNKIVLPNSLEENLAYLFEWKKSFNGDSFVYDYPLGRAHYGDLGYMKISKVIYRDIQFLNKLELNGYISCQELRAGFPHNFPNYVMGKMLWNKTLAYEDLVEEYFSAMYGDNHMKVVKYLETLSEYSSCDYFNAIGDRISPELGSRYNVCVNVAKEFMNEIEINYSACQEIQKEQWRVLSYHREYVIKISKALTLIAEGENKKGQIEWRDTLDLIRRSEASFQPYLDVYRVIEVAKNYAGFTL
ncbi:MAG: DUF4838 domain-containing protein [Turicibacter sp.]